MCFHFQQQKGAVAFEKKGLSGTPIKNSFNGFSHPEASVITDALPNQLSRFQWGLIPSWSKDRSIQKYTLNAKLETLQEKPSFRKNKRCLVPTDGFFEWQWQDLMGKKKQKYKIVIGQEELFMFAGLWDTWLDVATGELVYTFAVVTTEAQGIMRQIHNTKLRMPLVLTNEQEQNWLLNKVVEPFSNFEAKPVE
ncbi:MAG: DUF159 family protein [Flavobacteriales bacterium MED-G22]|nr:MAG: DUF159 family protein [Flavobacteriales bacterium MED-G22]|tara:strand:- start:10664 stop:11245 length:582 start_codon:yes stop_codon:yes gene_type:complete